MCVQKFLNLIALLREGARQSRRMDAAKPLDLNSTFIQKGRTYEKSDALSGRPGPEYPL